MARMNIEETAREVALKVLEQEYKGIKIREWCDLIVEGEYVRKTDAINEVNNAIAKYIPLLHGSLEKIPLDAARAINRMKGDQVIKVLNKTPAQ